jgi:hypothetical protein
LKTSDLNDRIIFIFDITVTGEKNGNYAVRNSLIFIYGYVRYTSDSGERSLKCADINSTIDKNL